MTDVECRDLVEKQEAQLELCLKAAIGNLDQPVVSESDKTWTPAYQAILDLRKQLEVEHEKPSMAKAQRHGSVRRRL